MRSLPIPPPEVAYRSSFLPPSELEAGLQPTSNHIFVCVQTGHARLRRMSCVPFGKSRRALFKWIPLFVTTSANFCETSAQGSRKV